MSVPIILALAAVIVIAVVMGVVLAQQKDAKRRATALTRTGAALMTVFTVFGGAFTGGYAMEDFGGSAGLMMILAWAAPVLILAVLAWLRPAVTAPVLMALSAAFLAVCLWFAVDPTTARNFQDATGPVLAVGVVALAFPAAILGLKRTGVAGWLLLALGVLPLLITIIGRSGPVASLAAASVVPLITGAVYLVAARLARGRSVPDSVRTAAV